MDLDFLHLNFRRRIGALVWARRAVPLLALLSLFLGSRRWGVVVSVIVVAVLFSAVLKFLETSLRRQFIREARLPPFLIGKLREAHPQLSRRDAELVLRGLRQFFMSHLRSDRKFVAMPSKVVDTAWHEFILHTQGYQNWCKAAFGGMLHHSPAEVLGRDPKRNDGLRRTWYWACKEESIDPRNPARLPLLFALDVKFAIAGGLPMCPTAARWSATSARTPSAAPASVTRRPTAAARATRAASAAASRAAATAVARATVAVRAAIRPAVAAAAAAGAVAAGEAAETEPWPAQ